MTTGGHAPVVILSKSHSEEWLGPLLRNVSLRSTFPSSVPRKRTRIRPGNSLWVSTVSRSYQRSDLEIIKNTLSYSHSLYCDQVDVTLSSKEDPSLFRSPAALQYWNFVSHWYWCSDESLEMNVSNVITFVLTVPEYYFLIQHSVLCKNMSSITEENNHDFILVQRCWCTILRLLILLCLLMLRNKIPSNTNTQYNERCRCLAQLNI